MKKLFKWFTSSKDNISEKRYNEIKTGLAILIVFVIAVLAVVIVFTVNTVKDNKGSSSSSSSEITELPSSSKPMVSIPEPPSVADSSSQSDSSENDSEDSSQTDSEEDSSVTDIKPEGISITYNISNSWENGSGTCYQVDMGITNNSPDTVSGWEIKIPVKNVTSVEGWNGTYKIDGDSLVITPADHNKEIFKGGNVTVGFIVTSSGSFEIESAEMNGESITVIKGTVSGDNNQQSQGGNQQNQNGNQNNSEPVDVSQLLERNENAKQGDDWLYVKDNKIVDKDGKEVWLTGVNWFGYNTGTNIFDGLWGSELVSSVEAIADHGFNLIRIPFSAELINQWAAGEYPQANYNQAYNSTLNSMNSLQIFDYVVKLCEDNGIKIMIDIHSAETNASGHVINLWYTDNFTAEEYYSALEWMAERYKDNDTIIAYDLKNEPHGKPFEGDAAAIWNDSKDANNWKYVAEQAAARILAKNPNVLIMVEGIEIYPIDIDKNGDFASTNEKDYYFNWWGGNLRGVKDYPVDLGKYQNKLVYSPHDYGPTVYQQPWFKGDYDYDSLMKDCWGDNWFYIYEDNIAPLLIGEWGGFMKEPNLKWMTCMRELIKKYNLHHTFWCFNANSGDTGGLVLDDFTTWDEEKYEFVKQVLWQQGGKFVGLDHEIPLGDNGITLSDANGL